MSTNSLVRSGCSFVYEEKAQIKNALKAVKNYWLIKERDKNLEEFDQFE